MIAALLAAAVLQAAPAMPELGLPDPSTIVDRYEAALAAHPAPRTFTVEYTLEQSGTRTLEQSHRIFRQGADERDELVAVNGTRETRPQVRIFRGRRDRYAVRTLAPTSAAYAFHYVGSRRDGHHSDYVFRLTPKAAAAFAFTGLTIDGLTYMPAAVTFATRANGGSGTVTFAKSGAYWVATGADASARLAGGIAHERLTFMHWRFPASLPPATFGGSRTPPKPALPSP